MNRYVIFGFIKIGDLVEDFNCCRIVIIFI
jgi:hypothetical protein